MLGCVIGLDKWHGGSSILAACPCRYFRRATKFTDRRLIFWSASRVFCWQRQLVRAMEFLFIWIIIQVLNIVVWVLFIRVPTLRLLLDRTVRFWNFTSPTDKSETSRAKQTHQGVTDERATLFDYVNLKWRRYISTLRSRDMRNLSGFAPPRAMRTIITVILVIQNVIGLTIFSQNEPLRKIFRQSGQLACLNLLPLTLLSCPPLLEQLLGQTSPQTAWAHHLYGWIVWYETLLHVLLYVLLHTGLGERCPKSPQSIAQAR